MKCVELCRRRFIMTDNCYIEWDSEIEEILMTLYPDEDTIREIAEMNEKNYQENKYEF